MKKTGNFRTILSENYVNIQKHIIFYSTKKRRAKAHAFSVNDDSMGILASSFPDNACYHDALVLPHLPSLASTRKAGACMALGKAPAQSNMVLADKASSSRVQAVAVRMAWMAPAVQMASMA